jgi:hypothetical protein
VFGRRYTISSTILIIVLLIHILFLIACSLYTITYNTSKPAEQKSSEPYIYIPMTEQSTQQLTMPTAEPINTQPPIPEPLQTQPKEAPPAPPEDPDFASLFQKIEQLKVPEEIIVHKAKDNAIDGKNGDVAVHIKKIESPIKEDTVDTPATPPKEVATDDIPMPFVGINNKELTERDTLFHQFIKAVNTAIYATMHQSNPPYTPGAQPVLVRLVIVRTGRLAQAPTVIRSSGNKERDTWYVNAIQKASAQFPPIPPSIHLPFAELTYKEGMRAGSPIR